MTRTEAQDLLTSLEQAANSIGLRLIEGKTKYIGVNIPEGVEQITAASGEDIEKVRDFVYIMAAVS